MVDVSCRPVTRVLNMVARLQQAGAVVGLVGMECLVSHSVAGQASRHGWPGQYGGRLVPAVAARQCEGPQCIVKQQRFNDARIAHAYRVIVLWPATIDWLQRLEVQESLEGPHQPGRPPALLPQPVAVLVPRVLHSLPARCQHALHHSVLL
jgi:hypothetical protein